MRYTLLAFHLGFHGGRDGCIQPPNRQAFVDTDGTGDGANLRALVERGNDAQIAVLERLEVAQRDLGFPTDVVERQTSCLARLREPLSETATGGVGMRRGMRPSAFRLDAVSRRHDFDPLETSSVIDCDSNECSREYPPNCLSPRTGSRERCHRASKPSPPAHHTPTIHPNTR